MLAITDKEFDRLVKFVRDNYGIELAKKRVLVEGRLSPMLKERGINTYTEYFDKVLNSKSSDELITLINKLTTNHTFFMREKEHFDYFRDVCLPYFERTIPDRDIRIWSAACSSGEEPYTFAMVIDEYFGTKKSQWDAKILCSDISMQAMNKAKAGIYATEALKDLPDAWKKKYFTDIGNGQSQVIQRIKDQLVFKTFNLMDPIQYKKPFDIIICRNVMIYFDNVTKHAVVDRFFGATKKGGFLFIGHAESLERDKTRYRYIRPAVYRKEDQ